MNFKRFFLYLVVGATGTGVQYAILFALVASNTTGPVAASSAGALAGAVVNYCLNYRFTFVSNQRHTVAAPRFICVAAVGLGVNWLVMTALIHAMHVNYIFAQITATAVVLVLTFSVNSMWSFRFQSEKE